MIYHVKLTKHDTCYTYALKRTGRFTIDNVGKESNEFLENFELETCPEEYLLVGDILVYKFEIEESNKVKAEFEITADREILMDTHYYDIHFMVYEGNGIISHAILTTENNKVIHKVAMRRLADGSPDWFRLKT